MLYCSYHKAREALGQSEFPHKAFGILLVLEEELQLVNLEEKEFDLEEKEIVDPWCKKKEDTR